MVPPEFANFFIASAGAGAALVGLLFVAISLAPEQIVTRRAPVERQAVAGSAFTSLVNAFQLIKDPSQVGNVYALVLLLLGVFILGLTFAWELLGVQWGLFGWLNPLRDVQDTESFSRAGNSHAAVEQPTTDDAALRSPPP